MATRFRHGGHPTHRREPVPAYARAVQQPDIVSEARRLVGAWHAGRPIPSTSSRFADFDRSAGYRVQAVVTQLLSGELGRRVGWKLGLTSLSAAVEPFSGPLHADMLVPSGGSIRIDGCIVPRVEVELAIVLGTDVLGPLAVEDIGELDLEVAAAFEIIDDRTAGSTVAADWVADFATMRHAVIGAGRRVDLTDASGWRASLFEDGREVASGRVGDVVLPPAHSLMWLSRHLAQRGLHLTAGDVILTGSVTGQHRPLGGSRYRGELAGFAPVEVGFEPAGQ